MSHVALTTYRCPVCGITHSRNADVLLHKRMRDIKPEETFGGLRLCEEHFKEGFSCLIEADPVNDGYLHTGNLGHVRHEAAVQIFKDFDISHEFVFVEVGVLAGLKLLAGVGGEEE